MFLLNCTDNFVILCTFTWGVTVRLQATHNKQAVVAAAAAAATAPTITYYYYYC